MRQRLATLLGVVSLLFLLAPGAALADETPQPKPKKNSSDSAQSNDGAKKKGANGKSKKNKKSKNGASEKDQTDEPVGDEVGPDEVGITVTLFDSSNKDAEGNDTPLPGVTLVVSTEGEDEVGQGATGDDGRVVIKVPEKGTYVVTLDEDTLPEGISLDESTKAELTISARLNGPNNFAAFPIGVIEGEKAGFGSQLLDSIVSGLKFGLIIGLAALGLSIVFGATKLSNFAHGELVTLGMIVTYWFNWLAGLPVIIAGVLAVIVGAGFGWVQDRALWRPLRNRGTGVIAMMIISIGFGLFLRSVFQYVFGGARRSYSEYTTQERRSYGPIELADKEVAIIVIATVAIVAVSLVMAKTRLGKGLRAVSDNAALAASSGMRVDRTVSYAWIIGTALAALSGVLLGVNSQVRFLSGFELLLLIFAAVTLGGFGTIWGALFGSLVIGLMVEVGPVFGVPSSIKEVGALVVLIAVLLIRPQGIFGRAERVG